MGLWVRSGEVDEWEQELWALWDEYWIPVGAILSLSLQLLLVFTGSTRKWHPFFAAAAWMAYNAADYVATLVLGGMAQQSSLGDGTRVFSVWAPILLLHLGAPDNISAYAMEDSELWLRHGLTMSMQLLAATFVVLECVATPSSSFSSNSSTLWILLSAALLVAGSFKYAERTLALRASSSGATVGAVLPIYEFMRLEPFLSLAVKGEANGEAAGRTEPEAEPLPEPPRFFYIMTGERTWYSNLAGGRDVNSFAAAAASTPSFLTLQDILQTSYCDPTLSSSSPRLLRLCLAFSLFKLYRRRLCRLFMYEWRHPKSRHLFFHHPSSPFFPNPSSHPDDVFFVLDAELRFLYDSLYKKSAGTAFTALGVIFRVFTAVLLLLSAAVLFPLLDVDLREEDSNVKGARVVTFLLVMAGVIIEVYQVARLLLSDWTVVWLVCTHVHLLETCRSQTTGAPHFAVRLYGWFKRLVIRNLLLTRSNLVLRGMVYWTHHVGQSSFLSVVPPPAPPEPAPLSLPLLPLFRFLIPCRPSCAVRRSLPHPAIEYLSDQKRTDSFRHDAIQDVLHLCHRLLDEYVARNGRVDNLAWLVSVDGLRTSEYREWRQPFQIFCVYIAALRGSADTEAFITSWHVATLVCEALEDEESVVEDESSPAMNGGEQRGMGSASKSKILSRYAMYLLLNKTELLPCHPDIGRRVARGGADTLGAYMEKTRQYMEKKVVGNINAAIFKTLIMEAAELRVQHMEEEVDLELIREELDMVRGKEEEDSKELELKLEESSDLLSPAMAGLMAGKLLMLGIENKEERWDFLWEIWVEVLCCMASPNSVNHHLRQLTEGGQFLTHVWLLLGHMGFGSQG